MPLPLRLKGFKLRKNKSFKYVPRYTKNTTGENVYSFESKFSKYRETPNALDYRSNWKEARMASRHKGNREINIRLVIIIAILIFIVLWFFDFDLSIFINP